MVRGLGIRFRYDAKTWLGLWALEGLAPAGPYRAYRRLNGAVRDLQGFNSPAFFRGV